MLYVRPNKTYWEEFADKTNKHIKIANEQYGGHDNTVVGGITGITTDSTKNRILLRILEYKDTSTEEWCCCWLEAGDEDKLTALYQKIEPFGGWYAAVDRSTNKVLDVWHEASD